MQPDVFKQPLFQKCQKFVLFGLPILLLFKCASLKTILRWFQKNLKEQHFDKRAIFDAKVLAQGDAKVLARLQVQKKRSFLGQNLAVNFLNFLPQFLKKKQTLSPLCLVKNEKRKGKLGPSKWQKLGQNLQPHNCHIYTHTCFLILECVSESCKVQT